MHVIWGMAEEVEDDDIEEWVDCVTRAYGRYKRMTR